MPSSDAFGHGLERWTRRMMLMVGLLGFVVIYGGGLYLYWLGADISGIAWGYFICPWLCIFFSFSSYRQKKLGLALVKLPKTLSQKMRGKA